MYPERSSYAPRGAGAVGDCGVIRFSDENIKKEVMLISKQDFSFKLATTYSPTLYRSTIGASELNFSVRNGLRWILTAIIAFLVRESGFTPFHDML
jgi:hypothetical protein